MGFFDFDEQSFEAAPATTRSASPASPSASSAPRSTVGATPKSSPSSPSSSNARPSGKPTKSSPVTPAKPVPGVASTIFDGFKKYAPGALDFAQGVVGKFTGGGQISDQQAWDLARGAVQQVTSIAGDQPAAARPSNTWQPPPIGGDPSSRAPAYLLPPTLSDEPSAPAGPTAAAGPSPAVAVQPPPSPPAYVSPPGYRAPYSASPVTAPSPYGGWPGGQPGTSVDTLGMLLQALQQRQIPPLPGPFMQPAGVPQHHALALLSLILANPYLQRTLQSAQTTSVQPRTVDLPLPATTMPARTRPVSIPLGAVMNAIVALAGHSMTELNESTPDEDPEVPSYLVGDDGDFLVDPSSPNDRAALVAYLFRMSYEAQRAGYGWPSDAEDAVDESEAWAEAAGFK